MSKANLPITTAAGRQPAAANVNRFRFQAGQTFSALQYPNYRLWFAGQLVSLVGTWMQSTAQGFLVFELTKSPAFLGYVSAAAGLPSWLIMLYAGVIADRMPRRTLMLITQSCMMILAFILAWLTFTNQVQPWHILMLATLLGTANAFDAPGRQAFTVELVDRQHLTNAIALNSSMFNLGTAVGPAVAGIAYATLGPAWCFTVNGMSFIAVIAALCLMKLPAWVPPVKKRAALADLIQGFQYVRSAPIVLALIIGIGIVSLFGLSFVPLFPAWAVNILGGDATTNGMLQSARGVGALVGALLIASAGSHLARGKLLTVGTFIFPVLLSLFALARWLPVSLLILVGIGWAFMTFANLANSIVQTQVPDELRGRVLAIYTLSFFGLMPIGALIAGTVADRLGEPAAVLLNASLLAGFAIFTYLKFPQLRAHR